MSQELSRSNQCRQLLGYTFYEGLRAAAAAVSVLVMSLHVKGMCTSAMTDCITLNCLIALNLQLCSGKLHGLLCGGRGLFMVMQSWKRASAELCFLGLYSIPCSKAW